MNKYYIYKVIKQKNFPYTVLTPFITPCAYFFQKCDEKAGRKIYLISAHLVLSHFPLHHTALLEIDKDILTISIYFRKIDNITPNKSTLL